MGNSHTLTHDHPKSGRTLRSLGSSVKVNRTWWLRNTVDPLMVSATSKPKPVAV